MNAIWEWVMSLPQSFSGFVDWLTTPIGWGTWSFTPLIAIGAGAVVFFTILVGLKIKNLIL